METRELQEVAKRAQEQGVISEEGRDALAEAIETGVQLRLGCSRAEARAELIKRDDGSSLATPAESRAWFAVREARLSGEYETRERLGALLDEKAFALVTKGQAKEVGQAWDILFRDPDAVALYDAFRQSYNYPLDTPAQLAKRIGGDAAQALRKNLGA